MEQGLKIIRQKFLVLKLMHVSTSWTLDSIGFEVGRNFHFNAAAAIQEFKAGGFEHYIADVSVLSFGRYRPMLRSRPNFNGFLFQR
jgi:hypothetical protein